MDPEHGERLASLETQTKAQTIILTEICRDVKSIRRDTAKHELADTKQFGAIDTRIAKVENNLAWAKKIALLAVGWLHVLIFGK